MSATSGIRPRPLLLELSLLAALGWVVRPAQAPGTATFSHHELSGWSAVAVALGLLMFVEAAVVHLMLSSAGTTAQCGSRSPCTSMGSSGSSETRKRSVEGAAW